MSPYTHPEVLLLLVKLAEKIDLVVESRSIPMVGEEVWVKWRFRDEKQATALLISDIDLLETNFAVADAYRSELALQMARVFVRPIPRTRFGKWLERVVQKHL